MTDVLQWACHYERLKKKPIDYPDLSVKPTPSMNTQITAIGSAEPERRHPSPTQSECEKFENSHMLCDTLRTNSEEKSIAVIITNEDETITLEEFQNKKILNGQRVTQV